MLLAIPPVIAHRILPHRDSASSRVTGVLIERQRTPWLVYTKSYSGLGTCSLNWRRRRVDGNAYLQLCAVIGGQDHNDKHGISAVTATRLGGIAIVAYMGMHLGYQAYLGVYSAGTEETYILLACAAFSL